MESVDGPRHASTREALTWSAYVRVRTLILVVPVMATIGACTSSHSSHGVAEQSVKPPPSIAHDPSNHALCDLVHEIDAADENVTTSAEALAVLRSYEPKFKQMIAAAPSTVRSPLQTLVDASEHAIASGGPDSRDVNSVAIAGAQLDAYCK